MARWKKIAVAALVLLAALEVGIRATGINDFPLSEANPVIGYVTKPNQSGRFLRTKDWQFNALSMGTTEFRPTEAVDLLLIGDSIVNGGNPFKQAERLGPQLQRISGFNVWPISAGSWSLRNELAYLALHPEVVQNVDRFVFVLNSEDFGDASSWTCHQSHPMTKPLLASVFVFRKYIYNWPPCSSPPPELLVAPGDWKAELGQFLRRAKGKEVSFFLYPLKSAVGSPAADGHRRELAEAGAEKVFSISEDGRWHVGLYRDEIHPTVEGTRVLADILYAPASATSD